jgi:Flp pilus assembly protein TadG
MIGSALYVHGRQWLAGRTQRLWRDERGIAATEFAVIVPLMLTMFFGTVEMSSGVAVDRKVTLIARTLSDLVSQSTSVNDSDMSNFFSSGSLIMWPYGSSPINATVSELYVDPTTLKARVQWSKATGSGAVRATGSQVTIPTALATGGVYLIYSEVNYLYVPAVGYIMNKLGVTLSDTNFTRPRQSTCVLYNTATCPTS